MDFWMDDWQSLGGDRVSGRWRRLEEVLHVAWPVPHLTVVTRLPSRRPARQQLLGRSMACFLRGNKPVIYHGE